MRSIVWLLLVTVIAVVSATALGANDGLVTIYWRGWRTDVSLNLFLLIGSILFLSLHSLARLVNGLMALPSRAKEWRTTRRDRAAQAALREGLALYLAGRYTRAHKTCQKAISIQANTPELNMDAEFTALAHMLSAGSLHRLQDHKRRDEHLQRALNLSRLTRKPRATEEGARLMAAEYALDDHDADKALQELSELPPGVARRTQALRLRLQAARLSRQPMEALRTARLLAKHQGFTPTAAQGLLRTLVTETLDGARDIDQMRSLWMHLDSQDKRDPMVASHAARRMSQLGAPHEARQWLAPLWTDFPQHTPESVDALAHALRESLSGLESEWLPRLDACTTAALRNPHLALTVGLAMAERQLWGKARGLLLSAANDLQLKAEDRKVAWAKLGQMAERENRPDEAARFFRQAALPE